MLEIKTKNTDNRNVFSMSPNRTSITETHTHYFKSYFKRK